MDDPVSAAPDWRRASDQADHPDAEERHHGRGTDTGHGGRNPPGVDSLPAAVEHLPALCVGPVVQPAGEEAESR